MFVVSHLSEISLMLVGAVVGGVCVFTFNKVSTKVSGLFKKY